MRCFCDGLRECSGYTILCLMVALTLPRDSHAAPPSQSEGREFTTIQRMSPEKLAALHEDVEKLKASRRDVSLSTGLTDFHGILHAHANDSAHTGGTLPEMLADAKSVGVDVILLGNHIRPPFDFVDDSWRGMHEGVLFIPGAEHTSYGLLMNPEKSVMDKLDLELSELIAATTEGSGLIFLSHVEARVNHPMDGLTGMEIYNNHYDAMDDQMALMGLLGKLTDPVQAKELEALLNQYPAEMYAAIVDYPKVYINKWDEETQKQRVVGIAANDCHHNQVYLVKMKDEQTVLLGTVVDKDEDMRPIAASNRNKVAEMVAGHAPGDILVRLDFDPYARSFLNCSTHILAEELTEPSIRAALLEGHAYVAHDWLSDPTGFAFNAKRGDDQIALMGDELTFTEGIVLEAESPLQTELRLLRDGKVIQTVADGWFEYEVEYTGVYRVEAWVVVGGEKRPWIYSNPIYVRAK